MADEQSERHESVLALLKEAEAEDDALSVIRRKSRELIAKHEALWKGPPFCPTALADLEGIYVEEVDIDIKSDGRIFPRGSDVVIQFVSGQTHERQRFTIAHELAHTLFPDCYKRERRRSKAEKAFLEFENLCNAGASEFLFPRDSFLSDLGGKFPDAEEIAKLAGLYEASFDATARRLVDLTQQPACAVFSKYVEPTGSKKPRMDVCYSVPNEKFPVRVYPNFRINSNLGAVEAHQKQSPVTKTIKKWRVGDKWLSVRACSLPLVQVPGKDLPHVVSVFVSFPSQ